MYFKQFYLGCLSHGSYLIGSGGEAAVIDPQRDVDQYIEEAEKEGLSIKYVIETHLHADFVSGHRELAERTGAQIVFGAKAGAAFPHIATSNGDVLRIGTVTLSILETPGHTPESICILARDDEENRPAMLFSGDTLFIGDVGRPDLVGSKGFSAEEMAGLLYESLHEKLLKLPDEVEVYPAHGAGSLCGKNLSDEKSSTIGQQRQFNYALKPMTKDEFVKLLTTDQPEVPAYFTKDVEINRLGASALSSMARPQPLTTSEVAKEMQRGAIVLDIRKASEYASGHISGSLNIGLSGQFASWAGTLIEVGTPLILVANDPAQIEEAIMRLARVGIESVVGYFENAMSNWEKADFPVSQSAEMTVAQLKRDLDDGSALLVLDVRRCSEYNTGHVPEAINIPLAELAARVSTLPKDRSVAVVCASGYRSSIAISVLERGGLKSSINVTGGTTAWKNASYPLEARETAMA